MRKFQNTPSVTTHGVIKAIDSNMMFNCPVTPKFLKDALDIFGPSISNL